MTMTMHVVGWTPGSGAGKGSSHARPGRAGTPWGRNAQNWSFADASGGDIHLECKVTQESPKRPFINNLVHKRTQHVRGFC